MIQLHAYCLLTKSPGTCITARIWWCRKSFSQWECSFHWKLHCHWLKGLWQCQIVVVIQGPIHVPVRLIWISPESPDPYGFSELKMMFNSINQSNSPSQTHSCSLRHRPSYFFIHPPIPAHSRHPCSHLPSYSGTATLFPLSPSLPYSVLPHLQSNPSTCQPTPNSLAHSVIYLPTNPLIHPPTLQFTNFLPTLVSLKTIFGLGIPVLIRQCLYI